MAIVERADRPNGAAAGNPDESWQADAARECSRVYGDKCRTTGSVAPNEVSIVTNNGTVAFPSMSAKPITDADLQGMTPDALRVMRNIPFAQHGRQFEDPALNDLFSHQPWYHSNQANSDLSAIETRNIEFLHMRELDQNLNGARSQFDAAPQVPEDTTGLLLRDSASRPLTDADLANLSDADLRIARNEILARHGHQFQSPDLKQRFESLPWYKPSQDPSSEKLSYMEARNLEFIQIQELDRRLRQQDQTK